MSNELLEKQLSRKKRTINDLARFIKTKAGKSANFTLLMGAGCSVSSGVRPATKLSDEWVLELYRGLNRESKETDLQKIREWFQLNESEWYNKDHEYSCLFEKRFDLPSQRRSFVEEEVAGKFPSLGYAYLIRLIEKSYFNTVFTTNFDDLLNEAFHLFANRKFGVPDCMSDIMRPIVCAHDSSIKSISITSSRPKIIKLHGDYLFDDIKSTLRETESLEDNIRDKFVEFCKEFGLIVVGYSGNDRSIMDVLNYLLKSDDYLKNGIYWCLREKDAISDEVKKLLWKDRVYYVYIDGYDELFADLYKQLVPDEELPVSSGSLGLNNQILEKLSNNLYLKNSWSPIIKRDIKKLGEENKKNSFFKEIKSVIFDEKAKDSARGLTSDQTVKLMEIDRCLEKNQFDRAIELVTSCLACGGDMSYAFKTRLLRLKAIVLDKMGNSSESLRTCDELIELTAGDNYEFYLLKDRFILDYEQCIGNLREYIKTKQYDYRAYEAITEYEWKLVSQAYIPAERYSRLLEDLNKGISCNPSSNNECYSRKFDFLLEKKEAVCKNWKQQADELMKAIEKQDPQSPLLYSMRLRYSRETETDSQRQEECRSQIWDEISKGIAEQKWPFRRYLGVLIEVIESCKKNWGDRCAYVYQGIRQSEWQFHTSHAFLSMAVSFLLYNKKDLELALTFLKQMPDDTYGISDVHALLDIELLTKDDEKRKDVREMYNKIEKTFKNRIQKEFSQHQAERKCDYVCALNIIRELKKDERYEREYFTEEMHAMLWQGDFQGVFDESQRVMKDDCASMDRGADVINYQIARVKLDHKPKKEKLENLIKDRDNDEIKAAALLLLGKDDESCDALKGVICHDLQRALSCRSYYVFQKMGSEKIRRIIEDACKV